MLSSLMERMNDRRDATGDAGADAGFTLIELMVVLLILAILLAIAIPTFLGVTKSANDRAAQSNLNTALLNAKAQYQNNSQAYPQAAALVTALQSAEPSLQFTAGNSADQNHISVAVTGDGAAVVLAAFSAPTKNCWMIVDVPTAPDLATAPVGPFALAAGQAPAVAVDTTLGSVGATTPVKFAISPLGPTYAEMKTSPTGTVTAAACVASAPSAIANTSYRWSNSAFPSI
jgi:type IV pilus assembly protein PilA